MIDARVDPASTAEVVDYMEAVGQRVLQNVRDAMQEWVEGLAWTVADKLQGNPIVSRSGRLLESILQSPRVWENSQYIGGTVSANDGYKNLGLWLEKGISVPALVAAKGVLYAFYPPGQGAVFTRKHRAFKVQGKPFMEPSLEEDKPLLMQLIQAKVNDAESI